MYGEVNQNHKFIIYTARFSNDHVTSCSTAIEAAKIAEEAINCGGGITFQHIEVRCPSCGKSCHRYTGYDGLERFKKAFKL